MMKFVIAKSAQEAITVANSVEAAGSDDNAMPMTITTRLRFDAVAGKDFPDWLEGSPYGNHPACGMVLVREILADPTLLNPS